MRDSVNCRVDEVRYFVKIVDVVRVDQVRVDQVGCSRLIEGLYSQKKSGLCKYVAIGEDGG